MARDEHAPNASPRVDLRRRTALKAMGAGAALAATAPLAGEAQAASSSVRQIKARFQPDAPEVKTFYRVNKYYV